MNFLGTYLTSKHRFRMYYKMCGETYELHSPTLHINNLFMGQMYVDLADTMSVKSLNQPDLVADVHFNPRSWLNKDGFKFNGEVYSMEGPDKKKKVHWQLAGHWNKQITLTNVKTKESEQVWTKRPYPERVDWMYGMSHYHLQLNYFPKRLQAKIAPTDSRRRPD